MEGGVYQKGGVCERRSNKHFAHVAAFTKRLCLFKEARYLSQSEVVIKQQKEIRSLCDLKFGTINGEKKRRVK